MFLNTLKPAAGSNKKTRRVGRGIGSGRGKTCGLGHKGQKARAGGYHKVGFEGGQMPIQRRLPKFGFSSRKKTLQAVQQVRLSSIGQLKLTEVTMQSLYDNRLINAAAKEAKIFLDKGELINLPITVHGIRVTAGAKKAIETAGGKVN
jgi:large subunit ribosomal protein L15